MLRWIYVPIEWWYQWREQVHHVNILDPPCSVIVVVKKVSYIEVIQNILTYKPRLRDFRSPWAQLKFDPWISTSSDPSWTFSAWLFYAEVWPICFRHCFAVCGDDTQYLVVALIIFKKFFLSLFSRLYCIKHRIPNQKRSTTLSYKIINIVEMNHTNSATEFRKYSIENRFVYTSA